MNQGTETHGQITTYGCTGSLVHEVWAIKYNVWDIRQFGDNGQLTENHHCYGNSGTYNPTIQKGHFKHNDKPVWFQVTSPSLRDNSLIRQSLPLNQLVSICY